MRFKIITLGCKVNTYESEFMLEKLKSSGYIYDEENPDIVIINTCSVTNVADAKSLKTVRKAKRDYPNCILVVCGCSVQNNQDKYSDLGIDILLGNREKSHIVELLDQIITKSETYINILKDRNLDFENMAVAKFTTHTRAFIKIQDGCNNFCSYCIIPYLRGNVRSKDFDTVIKEARDLVKNGHKEIVLTGIHTGSYNDQGRDLSDLLVSLAEIPELKRIRISSIEITELNDKFLNVLKNEPKICNHLHIPLQSGTDKILKKMNRKYDLNYYRNKIKEIRQIRKNIAITTDAIVGHPYETDSDFLEYLDFCREMNFAKIHVFPYSKREGTAASFMPEVDAQSKKKRAGQLLALSNELEANYVASFLNKELDVLTEEYFNNYTVGHTSNYLKVYLKNDLKLNTFYKCKITKVKNSIAYGKIITCNEEDLTL